MSDSTAVATTNRRAFVGGSDIPKIVGVSQWGDRFSLYLEKTGEIDPPDGETKVQRRGKILEPAIGRLYVDETGWEIFPGITARLPGRPHFCAQIDFLEETAEGVKTPLEIKSASEFTRHKWGPSGSDDAPTDYCAQLHWQMLAMDAPFGRIVALLGADDLRVYTIQRDPAIDAFLLDQATEFWQCVEERRPPPINFEHPSIGETLARLFNTPNALEIVQADDALRAWRDVMLQSSEAIKRYEAVKDGARAHLLAAMRNAALLDFGDGQMYERKVVKRKGFTVADTTYIDARLKKSSSNAGTPALPQEIAA